MLTRHLRPSLALLLCELLVLLPLAPARSRSSTPQEIASGSYQNRRWGDVKDIGFRQIAKGQEDDIKTGQDAIRQMKKQGLIPPD